MFKWLTIYWMRGNFENLILQLTDMLLHATSSCGSLKNSMHQTESLYTRNITQKYLSIISNFASAIHHKRISNNSHIQFQEYWAKKNLSLKYLIWIIRYSLWANSYQAQILRVMLIRAFEMLTVSKRKLNISKIYKTLIYNRTAYYLLEKLCRTLPSSQLYLSRQ